MRWFARPENDFLQLRVAPELDFWEVNDHPGVVRLRAYLDDTESLLANSKVQGPWALRLDVGRPADRDLLDKADLDNYALPLAKRLRDANLVSVWCTKEHRESSYVRVDAAHEVPAPPPAEVLVVETTASWQSAGDSNGSPAQRQLIAAVAHANVLPPGPVRLEMSFVIGPGRTWPNLWKPAIDSLDSLLGRTYPEKPRNPLDGRITELGLHVTVDPGAGDKVGHRHPRVWSAVASRQFCRVLGLCSRSSEPLPVRGRSQWFGTSWQLLTAPRRYHATPGSIRISPQSRSVFVDAAPVAQSSRPGYGPNIPAPVHHSAREAVPLRGVGGDADERPVAREGGGPDGNVREFRDDDAGYLAWLADHPDGYVINIGRSYNPAGARIHSVRCGHMHRPGGGVWTEGQYIKVCAPRLGDLEQWATATAHASIEACRACNPR